jgi:hypothetical protein
VSLVFPKNWEGIECASFERSKLNAQNISHQSGNLACKNFKTDATACASGESKAEKQTANVK